MFSPEHDDERPGRPGHPLPGGDCPHTPGASRFRRAVERRSAVPLVWLHQRPRWQAPLLLGVLFIVGLMAPGPIGALCLLLVAMFFVWLAFLTWPTLNRQQKTPRVLMTMVVLLLATARILGF